MANVNIPVTIQIRNAEFQKLASDQIRKQLSKDIASAVSSTGNLTKEFKDATASADAFTGRIATIARLINRGFTFKDRNVKAYFDTLTEGGKAAVSRLVTLQSAINKLQTGKISANAFNKILNAQVLPDPLDNSDRAKAFRSLVNSTVTAAALDYERLTKTVERETKKQTEIQIKEEQKRKRALENLRQKTVGDSVSADLFRERSSGNSRVSNLRSDITSRLNAEVQAEQKAADDYVQNSNFITQQVEKAKAELRKAFDAREQTRQDQAGKAAQTESKILQEADKTRVANLKDDIKNRYAILNKEEQAAFARQLDAVRNVALTSGNEARSIFQEAKRQAASLVRSGIISQEDFDVINRRFSEIAAKVQEINRIKAKDSDQGTIAAIGADGNALAREVQNGRDLVNTLNQAKTAAEQRAVAQKEQEASAKRLATLEERNNEIYRQRIAFIEKQQSLARETIAIANANGRLANNPSEELRRLERFASADPRSLVAVAPPGGGPPRPPVVGGGPEDFFSDDDAARRTVSRLRSVVAQQAKFNGIVQRFGELTGLAAKRYGAFLLGTFAITRLTSAFAAANQEALQFEKLIGRLSQTIRVFNDTLDQARSRGLAVGDAILEAARRTGVASNEIAQGVVEIAQAGNEQLGALQFVADQLANTQLSASFDDIKSTAEGLIAVQGQFNLQLSDTGNLLDKINQVSVEYAVESGNFFEAVKRGGATFAGLGGTFEEFIEYLTLIRSATRETAPTLGVFFKTGLGRLSKSAQQQIFQEFGVDAPGQGRSVIDQLRDLANAQSFQQLSDTERIRTTIALFGAQQSGRGEALLRELGKESGRDRTVQDVIGGSAGSVGRDIKIVEDDVNRSLGRITQSFQTFFNVLLQDQSVRKFFSGLADFFASIANFTSNNRDTLNFILKLTAATLTLTAAFQGLKFVKGLNLGLTGGISTPFGLNQGGGLPSNISSARRGIPVNFQSILTAGSLATLAGTFASQRLSESQLFSPTTNSVLSGGAAVGNGLVGGALIGSVAGPIGAAVGAAVGGLVAALNINSDKVKQNTEAIIANLKVAFLSSNPNSLQNVDAIRKGLAQAGNLSFAQEFLPFGLGLSGNVLQARAENQVDFLNANRSDLVTLTSNLIKNIPTSELNISDLDSLRTSLLPRASRELRDTLGVTNDSPQVLQKFINDFISGFFTSNFNFTKEFENRSITNQNENAIRDFDTSILEGIFQNLQNAARGFELNIAIVNKGFDRLSESLNRIVIDFTSLPTLSLNTDNERFRNSIGLDLSNITNRRNSFVEQANTLLGSSDTSSGTDQIPLLIKALKEVELPTQGAASELDVVQNIENLVNTTLSGFSDSVRTSVVDVLGTIKASTGDLQSALQLFLSADFDPAKFADNAFQLEKITETLRNSFSKFVDNVNLLSQKTLENNAALQQLYIERNNIERQITDSLLTTNENRIRSVSDRNTSGELGNFFATSAADRSSFATIASTFFVGRELRENFNNLVQNRTDLTRLESRGASPQELAKQQIIVTDSIVKYNDAIQAVNERQTDLARALDLASKAVGSFQEAINATRGGLRSLGQAVLQSDPVELRNQGNLVEGFRRFITRSPDGLDQGIRNSVGRLGSTEQAQELIKALENVAALPIAKDSGGILTGQDAINILLEEIGLRSFGAASGRGRSGRNEIEDLLREQRESLKKAQETEENIREEQINLQKDLLSVNLANVKALNANNISLETNTAALKSFEKVLQDQINNLNTNLIDPEKTGNILNANLKVEVEDIKVSFDTENLSKFGQNAVADALNKVGQVLTDLYIDEPEKLAKVKLLNVQADRIT